MHRKTKITFFFYEESGLNEKTEIGSRSTCEEEEDKWRQAEDRLMGDGHFPST